MGTRSNTRIFDDDGECILHLYKQFDGYPSGWGVELSKFLKKINIVNGFTSNDVIYKQCNGMDDLAAQLVAFFKKEIGGLYIHSLISPNQEYTYEIYSKKDIIYMKVISDNKILYDGLPSAFEDYLNIKDIIE